MERDKEIFKLILESIYFPVELEEANHLLLILQKRDFARSLFKVILRNLVNNFFYLLTVFKSRKQLEINEQVFIKRLQIFKFRRSFM